LRKVIEGLKAQGITTYGATGYCYGGMTQYAYFPHQRASLRLSSFTAARMVFDLAFDNIIHVSVVSHPSFLEYKDLDVRHSWSLLYAC
jgi:dienelactone hydrolase